MADDEELKPSAFQREWEFYRELTVPKESIGTGRLTITNHAFYAGAHVVIRLIEMTAVRASSPEAFADYIEDLDREILRYFEQFEDWITEREKKQTIQ